MRLRRLRHTRKPFIYFDRTDRTWRVQVGKKNLTFWSLVEAAGYSVIHYRESNEQNWQLWTGRKSRYRARYVYLHLHWLISQTARLKVGRPPSLASQTFPYNGD